MTIQERILTDDGAGSSFRLTPAKETMICEEALTSSLKALVIYSDMEFNCVESTQYMYTACMKNIQSYS